MAEEAYIPVHTEDNEPPPITEKSDNKPVPLGLKILVGMLSVISVALLITLLAVVVQWRDVRVNAVKKQEQTVCVSMTLVDEQICKEGLQREGNKHCCGQTSLLVRALVEKYSKEKFRDSSGARMLTETCLKDDKKVVAKLSGLDMDRTQQQGDGSIVIWNDSYYADQILQGVHYEHGYIKIEKSGYYFVFSQILLSSETGPTNNIPSSKIPYFSHSLHRGPSKHPDREKLLESQSSPCDTASEGKEMTNYIGAVFELNEGDVIAVETSHPQSLINSHENNFFGLYSV